ncbi:hypothetical protein HBH98_108680 [Parastagonospora nodorum]|nr:hypothetical protein HBH50_161060 [Parastagonospora nodorum]KAH4092265.1 hypothetical protein HBH48_084120 [Parastagonospora nodorum]KAH4345962.1 hypothetical protein HBH98_108680 [Parastagonospora nodorum]KAH4376860.1 hypothetical protein HBH97_114500 [Parastagonospora nodorum]KAH4397074.1 hypothetical protein HBH99_115990 [Parastagonospora nodorum]
MSTFHPFPRLPFELRAQIWEMTVEPRTVTVYVKTSNGFRSGAWRLVTPTPVPATLHSCREARNHGLYQKKFGELQDRTQYGDRYVWVNLDIDMIDILDCQFRYYKTVAPTIRRLKFEARNEEPFTHADSRDMVFFVNVQEIRVVCSDGFVKWGHATHYHPWPCAIENVTFIDPLDGDRTAIGLEIETIYRQLISEVRLEKDGVAWDSSDDMDDWPEDAFPEFECYCNN